MYFPKLILKLTGRILFRKIEFSFPVVQLYLK